MRSSAKRRWPTGTWTHTLPLGLLGRYGRLDVSMPSVGSGSRTTRRLTAAALLTPTLALPYLATATTAGARLIPAPDEGGDAPPVTALASRRR